VRLSSDFEALGSKRSRNARTLDSLTEGRDVGAGCEAGVAEVVLVSVGVVDMEFFESFVFQESEAPTDLIDPQMEEAFVPLDFTDRVSDVGDEPPEDDFDCIEGLSGRTLDTDIQWCPASRN
jgi:hypothetical protein